MKYLKVAEVADILNISQATVYKWVRLGILKPIRFGKTIRFNADDILAEG